MNQLSIFDFAYEAEVARTIIKKSTPLKTLKREKKLNIKRMEDTLMSELGTLYIHNIKNLKEYDGPHAYYSYLLKRINTTFFAPIIENINDENKDEKFKQLSNILSDDTVKFEFSTIVGRYKSMVRGYPIEIKIISSEREMTLITGSKETRKNRHRVRRYFPQFGQESNRMTCHINKVFAEFLLEKEIRNYFLKEDNLSSYKSIIKRYFERPETILCTEATLNNAILSDHLHELSVLTGKELDKIKPSHTTAIESSIKAYYGLFDVSGLGVLYSDPTYKDINGHNRNHFYDSLMYEFIENTISRVREVKYHVKQLRTSSKDYAATYQQKKNIPLKVMDRMKSSILLEYFTNVEYDESVDLNAITQFEEEIRSFINVFDIPVPSNASFKVRRLGKYKAAGLFFPAFNTLAVDVNNPHAFIHEFWHMIDYYMLDNKDEFLGLRLSSRKDFLPIVKAYKKVVENEMLLLDDNNPIRTRHNGKTKYNKDYFFDNTEIFARCAEIYFKEALDGSSSLVNDNESIYYPAEEKLNEKIKNYFDELLRGEDNEKIKAA